MQQVITLLHNFLTHKKGREINPSYENLRMTYFSVVWCGVTRHRGYTKSEGIICKAGNMEPR